MKSNWSPDNEMIITEFNRLKAGYSKITPEEEQFLTDCIKIFCFLQDIKACHEQLKEIDEMLADEMQKQNKNINSKEKGTVHVLRALLERELKTFDFETPFAQVIGGLSVQTFQEALAKGLILKDSAFRQDEHAEFTHAVQWLMAARQNKENPFLSEAIINVYKKMGSRMANPSGSKAATLWDFIADNNPFPENGFSSPQNLNKYILNPDNQLPHLRALMSLRAQKAPPTDMLTKEKQEKYTQTSHGLFERKPATQNAIQPIQEESKEQRLEKFVDDVNAILQATNNEEINEFNMLHVRKAVADSIKNNPSFAEFKIMDYLNKIETLPTPKPRK